MSGGSYLRFGIGLILSVSVLVSFFSNSGTSILSVLLAIIFLVLAALWAIFRF